MAKKSTATTDAKRAKAPSRRAEVLVAVMNNPADWSIVRDQLWYRIPVQKAPRQWPPQWLAFYQTKVFGEEAFAVRYYGKVSRIERIVRRELFPLEPRNAKSDNEYYQVFLEKIEQRATPIVSYRWRLIVFIATSYDKFMTAVEINDLFDESPLEDLLWEEMKKLGLRAERQYYLQDSSHWFALDFAVFCENGNIDIETDGDTWHASVERIPQDNQRNNALAAKGYQVLRFNTMQVREKIANYCVPTIVETVNRLGGSLDPQGPPRKYTSTAEGVVQQFSLFEDKEVYEPYEDVD